MVTSFASLPEELLPLILSHLVDPNDPKQSALNLARTSTVSRQFRRPAQALLWQNVHLDSDQEELALKWCEPSTNRLKSYTKSLKKNGWPWSRVNAHAEEKLFTTAIEACCQLRTLDVCLTLNGLESLSSPSLSNLKQLKIEIRGGCTASADVPPIKANFVLTHLSVTAVFSTPASHLLSGLFPALAPDSGQLSHLDLSFCSFTTSSPCSQSFIYSWLMPVAPHLIWFSLPILEDVWLKSELIAACENVKTLTTNELRKMDGTRELSQSLQTLGVGYTTWEDLQQDWVRLQNLESIYFDGDRSARVHSIPPFLELLSACRDRGVETHFGKSLKW